MTQKKGTAVTQRADALPDELGAAFAEDAGAGLETMTTDDKAIPFIALVQSLSPQRQRDNAKYIDDAEEGDIFNTVTSELYKADVGLEVIPIHFKKVFNVWTPRDEGGGFHGSFPSREKAGGRPPEDGSRFGKWFTDDGNEVVDTAEHYLLVRSATGAWTPALLSMTSTKLKVSRTWNTRMSMVTIPGTDKPAPTFARTYVIRSASQKNDKGTFHNYLIADGRWVTKEEYAAAKTFREALLKGEVKVDYTKAEDTDDGLDDTGEGNPDY